MNEELRPCPFCGCTVHYEEYDGIVHDRYVEHCYLNTAPYNGDMRVNIPKDILFAWWNGEVKE